MKNIFALLLSFSLCLPLVQAQSVPMGMKYQAVARDTKGNILADQPLQLRIELYNIKSPDQAAYAELHDVTTNALGLFTVTIGTGKVLSGTFERIPWSEADIWMEVAIHMDGEEEFVTISNSQMLSVPYAFHAATASELIDNHDRGSGSGSSGGSLANPWLLGGNINVDPIRDPLGTLDHHDLVIITASQERMRITAGGWVNVIDRLNVGGDIHGAMSVYLNEEGGQTINNGDFTVENGSATHLTGQLDVDGSTQLNNTLDVQKETTLESSLKVDGGTQLKSTLDVDGNTQLNAALNVEGRTQIEDDDNVTTMGTGALSVAGGVSIAKDLLVGGTPHFAGDAEFEGQVRITSDEQSTAKDNGALVVAGGAGIGKNLNVGGNVTIDGGGLTVKANAPLWAASIVNTNSEDGDGLVIRLGKTNPMWDGVAYRNITNVLSEDYDYATGKIRDYFNGQNLSLIDLINITPVAYLEGATCNLFNLLTDQLNTGIGLPAPLGPIQLTDSIPILPGLTIPPITIPELVVIPAIDSLDCTSLPTFTGLNVNFFDVPNSLNENNEFITFEDKDFRSLGSIHAESVQDWVIRYFDSDFLLNIGEHIIGLDFVSGLYGIVTETQNFVNSYNQIGVVYSSGHGDYAEWLERENPKEFISGGDIVGVKGGKITKDLAHAEQIMAVSSQPIVLGNAPEKGKEDQGNNIAFMGQIPVKIMGPVFTGDYILGNPTTPGYGIARHPQDMRDGDAALVVGRAWETIDRDGPKKVNTVIGVDNGYILQVVSNYQQQLNTLDSRLAAIENQLKKNVAVPESTMTASVDAKEKRRK